jgi:hypothetical protein
MYAVSYVSNLTKRKNKELNWIDSFIPEGISQSLHTCSVDSCWVFLKPGIQFFFYC